MKLTILISAALIAAITAIITLNAYNQEHGDHE